ncbi:MAG: FAD-dependent oxidoreductase [Paracoccaceae bacterium]
MTTEAETVDVLVIGSGAGALTTAVTAAKAGLKVLVTEKGDKFGGTTATSGGVLWIPGSRHARSLSDKLGVPDDLDNVRTYLRQEVGNQYDDARIEAYLEYGPRMVDYLEENTEVKFYAMEFPDYHPELPGGSRIRSIGTMDYDAGKMGSLMKTLKGELPQTLFIGLAIGSTLEMKQFLAAGRSPKAMAYVIRRMARHFVDLALKGSSQRIVRGRALIARLARTAHDMGVPFWLNAPAQRLIREGDRIVGAEILRDGKRVIVRARQAVVLGAGGFPRDKRRRGIHYQGLARTMDPVTPAPVTNVGDGIRMAEEIGARFNDNLSQSAAWLPTSRLKDAKDQNGVWPHLTDRNKPGFIMVLADGKRFANESSPYHDIVPAMLEAFEARKTDRAYLIGDDRAIRRWGMGFVRPFPIPKGAYLRNGYLTRAATPEELARKLDIDPKALAETIRNFSDHARGGKDPEFHRGESAYDRYQGDENHGPNPALGPLDKGPYYAVRIYPGEIGTYKGLKTDEHSRVIGQDDRPIEGLYAAGNDQSNVFGGSYPGAGATIGPAVTFGWIAARHIAGRAGVPVPGGA